MSRVYLVSIGLNPATPDRVLRIGESVQKVLKRLGPEHETLYASLDHSEFGYLLFSESRAGKISDALIEGHNDAKNQARFGRMLTNKDYIRVLEIGQDCALGENLGRPSAWLFNRLSAAGK